MEVEIPVNSRATLCIPKMGWHNVTVSEQGQVLFRNGDLAGTVAGVQGGSENTGQVELRIGSGAYSFTLTPD